VNRIVDSNSKYSDRPIEEMGAEKCITSIHIIVICYVVIYVDVKILFKSPEGDRIAAPANDDLFLKEKLVSEVLSLN